MARLTKILAIDGGGMRGVIPATVLMEIERRTGKPVAELFDLMAGTSTGGILAVGLAKPGASGKPQYSADDLRQLYFDEGTTIFPRSRVPFWSNLKRPLAEKYPGSGIEGVLRKYFGTSRLKDSCCDLVIPSYEISLRQPWFFRSHRARADPAYDFPLWEVARATSAAPTYFPPARIERPAPKKPWMLVDGGTFANNPALCAYAEARQRDPGGEVLLVSLGTGSHVKPIRCRPGLLGWARPILDIVFDGVSRTVEFQLDELLPVDRGQRRYYRFQCDLSIAGDALDGTDARSLRRLREQAEKLVRDQSADLDDLCAWLTR